MLEYLKTIIIPLMLLTNIFLIPPQLFGEEPTGKREVDPIYIGVNYALSGPGMLWGEMGQMGLTLAQEEINNAGGVNGRRIELIFEDSQTSPAKSVSAYQKLTTFNKTKIIIGDVWAFLTNPLIPLAEKDQVLLLSPTVMPESVERESLAFFQWASGLRVCGRR